MFKNKIPNESGYYNVKWDGEEDNIVKIYVNVINIEGETYTAWGWDENDDPEYLDIEETPNMYFEKY